MISQRERKRREQERIRELFITQLQFKQKGNEPLPPTNV